jgi:hypothetical protein
VVVDVVEHEHVRRVVVEVVVEPEAEVAVVNYFGFLKSHLHESLNYFGFLKMNVFISSM